MIDKNKSTPSRIPVRFVDDAGRADVEASGEQEGGGEDDTEQGRERTDNSDVAGSLPDSELNENREDQDTVRRARRNSQKSRKAADEHPPASPSDETGGAPHKAQSQSLVSAAAELLAAQAEVSILEEEVERLKTERQEMFEQMARGQADFNNYRKRLERERGESYGRLVAEVARQLLPVVDNLRRALDAESSVKASESEEFRNFLHGVELISRQLNDVLESLGLKPVETVGHRFDPHVHEAVATEQTEEYEPDTVMQEIQRGYRLGEKLLRPALVKVATR